MKSLYDQKQILKSEIEQSENNLNELRLSKNFNSNNNTHFERNAISAYENLNGLNDDISRVRYDSDPTNDSLHSPSTFNYDSEVMTESNIKKQNGFHVTAKLDDCNIYDYNEKETYEESISSKKPPLPYRDQPRPGLTHERVLNDIDDNLMRIEQMWNNFDLDMFDASPSKHKTLKLHHHHTSQSYDTDWATRITKPQPFSMTIRDEEKARLKKKLQKERDEAERQRMDIELKERRKPFKATPAPNHVYKPLYEQLIEKEALRAKRLYLLGQEYLDKNVVPFNLTEPQYNHSFSGETDFGRMESQEFVANPLPEFYFADDNITEKYWIFVFYYLGLNGSTLFISI